MGLNTKEITEPEELLDTRPQLSTTRLILRPFNGNDEAEVYRICREKEIAAMTRTIPYPYPRTQALFWIAQQPGNWLAGQSADFAICTRTENQLVGSIGLEINESDQNAELGYLIDKQMWGRGYCSEAAAEVLRFGFENLALHKIHAHCLTTNPGSQRVMEKIGMKQEGLLRGHVRKWGQFFDVYYYGLLHSEFNKTEKGAQNGEKAR